MRRSQRVPVERRALPTRERLRKAGRDVERGDTGAVTLRDSPLERAFLRRAISQEQYCAGQKHRHHWYHGGLSDPLRSLALDRVPAGPDAFSGMAVSERQAFHRQRHREAVAAVGRIGAHVLDWAVCREESLEQVGASLGWSNRPQAHAAAMERMKAALDALCRLWGIGQPS